MMRFALRALMAAALLLVAATPGYALDTRIVEIRIVGKTLLASIDLADVLPDKLRSVLESGGVLHVRIQAELWEDRPVWDRLVRPALVTVFRIVRDPTTTHIAVSDAVGPILNAVRLPNPLSLRVNIAPAEALDDKLKYYVRMTATVGTLGEREVEDTGAAVFGKDEGTVSLGKVGKLIFNTVLQANEFLQSVSDDARSAQFTKREVTPVGKPLPRP
jgi:hypothetical protein